MCKLCKSCEHNLGIMFCMRPIKGSKNSEMLEYAEVINDDGTCDHYKKEPMPSRIWDAITTPYYRVARRVEAVIDFFKYSVIGRMKYGFDTRDSWNLDVATAMFISPRLTKLINDEPWGVPCDLTIKDQVIKHKLEPYFNGELQDEWFGHDSDIVEASEAWMKILKEIEFGITTTANQWTRDFPYYTVDENGKKVLDRDLFMKHNERLDESFRLLGLFFRNLND